jgi:DNA-binding NtrC family response regulator
MQTYNYPTKPVLIVDDNEETLEGYSLALPPRGITNLIFCHDSRQAWSMLEKQAFSVVILDLLMPFVSGKELLDRIKENFPHTPVIIITGSTNIELAIQCIQTGTFDYLSKPVEINRLVADIKRAVELSELRNEVKVLGKQILTQDLQSPAAFSGIITGSPLMKAVFKYIEAIASSPRPILITGESGVGKELIAGVIHQLSNRNGRFVPVNTSGLDDTMFTDTLFGHKKSAFTGADKDREGLIKTAEEGTLFLDEIGELELKSQIKLLRLLQENKYYPLGSDTTHTCQARIVLATNANLEQKQQEGTFRKDLYYRIMTHLIHIPPLRERKEDLPFLVEHFVEKASQNLSLKKPHIPAGLYDLLAPYSFPGNVRELESIIFNAVSLSREPGELPLVVIEDYLKKNSTMYTNPVSRPVSSLASQVSNYGKAEPHSTDQESRQNPIIQIITNSGELPTFQEVEEYLIGRALEKVKGNQTLAAPLLGISQSALSRRIKKLPEV